MFLGLGMKRAHRSIRDRNDVVRVVFRVWKIWSEFVALKALRKAAGTYAPICGKIRPVN